MLCLLPIAVQDNGNLGTTQQSCPFALQPADSVPARLPPSGARDITQGPPIERAASNRTAACRVDSADITPRAELSGHAPSIKQYIVEHGDARLLRAHSAPSNYVSNDRWP